MGLRDWTKFQVFYDEEVRKILGKEPKQTKDS